MTQNSIFLNTINGQKCKRPPVWFMRQAGRVLPSYLELRKTYSFRELMLVPELAAKVTLLPVNDLNVDAVILFSDILVIPEALGMNLHFTDTGPVFMETIKNAQFNISKLNTDPLKLSHIYDTIKLIVKSKPDDVALIGFCGGPLTVFCYMVQGNSVNHFFSDAIQLIYNDKTYSKKLLELITELSIEYATNQVKAGIDTFQLFESYAGLLPCELYIELIFPYVKKILQAVRHKGCPTIFFPKGLGSKIKYINYDITDYVSIDWQSSLTEAREVIDARVGLQGNFDQRIFSVKNQEVLIQELEKYKTFGSRNFNWIFNTGHGLTPDNSYENVKTAVKWIKTRNWNR